MPTNQSIQLFSPFGGYVAENRDRTPTPHARTRGAGKWIAVAGLLALGMTTATAITKASRAPVADFSWSQSSNLVKTPFSGGFEEALY